MGKDYGLYGDAGVEKACRNEQKIVKVEQK